MGPSINYVNYQYFNYTLQNYNIITETEFIQFKTESGSSRRLVSANVYVRCSTKMRQMVKGCLNASCGKIFDCKGGEPFYSEGIMYKDQFGQVIKQYKYACKHCGQKAKVKGVTESEFTQWELIKGKCHEDINEQMY